MNLISLSEMAKTTTKNCKFLLVLYLKKAQKKVRAQQTNAGNHKLKELHWKVIYVTLNIKKKEEADYAGKDIHNFTFD